jgi:hypothetical protein
MVTRATLYLDVFYTYLVVSCTFTKRTIESFVLLSDEEYVRKQLRQTEQESGESLKSLRWDSAVLRKVTSLDRSVVISTEYFLQL